MYKPYRFSLDLAKTGEQLTVQGIRQGDAYFHKFIIDITDKGSCVDLSAFDTIVGTMYVIKPDSKVIVGSCEIVNNQVLYVIEPQDTSTVGVSTYQLNITAQTTVNNSTTTSTLGSPQFLVAVQSTKRVNIVESVNNFQQYTDSIIAVKNLFDDGGKIKSDLENKVDKDEVYKKAEVDTKLNGKSDKSTCYTKTEVDAQFDIKADKSDTYTKSEIDTELEKKIANQSGTVKTLNIAARAVTFEKLNSDVIAEKIEGGNTRLVRSTTAYTALSTKADKSDTYTKSEIDTELAKKINEEDVYTAEEADEHFQRILTAGDNIKIDDNKQGKITISADLSKKYDAANVESGSGELSLYSEDMPVTSAKFNYQKVGDFVMLTLNIAFSASTMKATKSYTLLGLPYINEAVFRKPIMTTTKNKMAIAVGNNSSMLIVLTQGEEVSVSDGESIQETLIYKIKK